MGRLGAALVELDTTIQVHVSQHYTDLLARAVANSQLEQSLALMATHIGTPHTENREFLHQQRFYFLKGLSHEK